MRPVIALVALLAIGCGAATPSTGQGPSAPASTPPPAVPSAASPSAALVPSPAPTASAQAQSPFTWERVAVVETAPDRAGGWRALAGAPTGYVALVSHPAAAWFSPDGTTWTESRLRVHSGTALSADAVAGADSGFVIVGSYTPCSRRAYARDPFFECRARPASWASADGRSWTEALAWKGANGEPGRSGSLFNGVWAVPTGGWDAVRAFDPSDESDGFDLTGATIYHSADGLAWKALAGQPAGGCGSEYGTGGFNGGADATGRRVVTADAEECSTRVWSSLDGQTWQPMSPFGQESPLLMARVVLPPDDAATPWMLLGWEEDSDYNAVGPRAWQSDDVASWMPQELPGATPGMIVLAGTRSGSLAVAAGGSATWTIEGTEGWRRISGRSPGIETMGAGPAGVLGLDGTWDAAGDNVVGFEVYGLRESRAP